MPKSQKKKADSTKPKQKPGNKGDFHGQRLAFLKEQLDGYLEASRNGKTRKFWPPFFEKYWDKFSWRLKLDEEPEEGATSTAMEVLSKEEFEQKAKVQLATKIKLKTWYNHHRNALGMASNPFTPWLSRLRRPDESCPKRTTDYQYYMQHKDHKEAVDLEFRTKHWDAPREKQLSLRCKVARDMFALESNDVRDRIRQEAQEEHDEELQRWKDAEEGLPSVEEENQKEARTRFASVVSPLLKALRAYTGYHITLVAGRMVEDKFDLVSVHAGTTKSKEGEDKGKDITQWNEQGYSSTVLAQFVRYLIAANAEPVEDTSVTPAAPIPEGAASSSAVILGAPNISHTGDDDEMPLQLLPQIPPAPLRQCTPPPPGSLEEKIQQLAVLESPLRRELDALARPERETRVAELQALSAMSLQRENNLARHREGAKAIPASATELADTQAKAPDGKTLKRKRGSRKAKGSKGKKRARRTGSDEEESASESDSDATDVEEEGRPEPPQTRSRKRGQPTPATSEERAVQGAVENNGSATPTQGATNDERAAQGATNDERAAQGGANDERAAQGGANDERAAQGVANDAAAHQGGHGAQPAKGRGRGNGVKAKEVIRGAPPEWATKARSKLQKPDSAGDWKGWDELTNVWWKWEESKSFGSGKSLSNTGRPGEVTWWIQRARKPSPTIDDLSLFKRQWNEWWAFLNPAWRAAESRGGALRREEGQDWECLKEPGVNGMYTVLICLKWWKAALDAGKEDAEWDEAVSDVTWAIQQMVPHDAPCTGQGGGTTTSTSATGAGSASGVQEAAGVPARTGAPNGPGTAGTAAMAETTVAVAGDVDVEMG
ncbi:hypothetical protein DFH06DRAFT_1154134 [Mycena polygramma]|nr:hypothetical protein DFH06DRAFT_1154134 [Mycena polygramma]